jgi:hypothetical protein
VYRLRRIYTVTIKSRIDFSRASLFNENNITICLKITAAYLALSIDQTKTWLSCVYVNDDFKELWGSSLLTFGSEGLHIVPIQNTWNH